MGRHWAWILFLLLVNNLFAQQKDCHIHTVQPGEGIYSISRLYTVKPSQIMAVNPDIGKEMSIKTGQKICIPKGSASIPQEQIEEEKRISLQEKQQAAKQSVLAGKNPVKEGNLWIHTVQKGETFYSICKLYGILAYDMIATNNLPNTLVMENQKLILPYTAKIPGQLSDAAKPKEVSPIEEMAITAHKEAVEEIKPNPTKQPEIIIEEVKGKKKKERKEEEPKKVLDTPVEKTQNSEQEHSETIAKQNEMVQPLLAPEHADATHIKTETYTVQKGDTYYSLTRKFNLGFNDIMKLNNLPNTDIKIGQTLKVQKPTPQPEIVEEKKDEIVIPPDAHIIDISKEVAKKDVAKKEEPKGKKKKDQPSKTKVKPEDIIVEQLPVKEEPLLAKKEDPKPEVVVPAPTPQIEAPQQTDPEPVVEKQPEPTPPPAPEVKTTEAINAEPISSPQPIAETPKKTEDEVKAEPPPTPEHIAEAKADIVKQEPVIEAKPLLSFSEEYSSLYSKNSANNNLRVKKQRGVAEYSDAITGNEYLVYYNDAEPGSIIKVTNLMNKQSAYVKVIGGIDATTEASSVIKVSKKLAKELKVLDDKFLVEVSKHTRN